MRLPWCLVWRGDGSFVTSTVGTRLGGGSPGAGVGSSVFPRTWGEPMLTDGHFFSLSVGWLVGWCQKWPLSSATDEHGWTELYPGKRGMVRAGGSASRIIGDRGVTDPGGGKRVLGGRQPSCQQQVGDARGSPWTPDVQAFSALGSHSSTNAGRRERPVSDNDGDVADGGTAKLLISDPEIGDPTQGMWPAGAGRSSPPKPVVDLSDVREDAVRRPLSVEAPEFFRSVGPTDVGDDWIRGLWPQSILPDYLYRWWLG